MVDSRAKGARTENIVKILLRDHTKLNWERVPSSGALDEKHGLKGDLYVPLHNNIYCVEVKGYAEDHLNSSVLSSKSPQLLQFWEQAVTQAKKVKKHPLLIFKHDRSKIFVAYNNIIPNETYSYIFISRDNYTFFIALLEEWLQSENPRFINE